MTRIILIAWTVAAALAALVLGVWVGLDHVVVGIALGVSALLLLGLAIALMVEPARHHAAAQPAGTPRPVVATQEAPRRRAPRAASEPRHGSGRSKPEWSTKRKAGKPVQSERRNIKEVYHA